MADSFTMSLFVLVLGCTFSQSHMNNISNANLKSGRNGTIKLSLGAFERKTSPKSLSVLIVVCPLSSIVDNTLPYAFIICVPGVPYIVSFVVEHENRSAIAATIPKSLLSVFMTLLLVII